MMEGKRGSKGKRKVGKDGSSEGRKEDREEGKREGKETR